MARRMSGPLLTSDRAVALLGGARASAGLLDAVLALCGPVAAADGGAAHALRRGIAPDIVIGDMDSLAPEDAARIPDDRIHRIAEQESTDFDKALRSIAAPLVIGAGFSGARADHLLGAYAVLVRRADRRCILAGEDEVCFLAPPGIALDLTPGGWFSLFPFGAVTGRSEGLLWPIEGLSFAPDGQTGTSNEVTGPVRLWVDAPRMLVILPRSELSAAVQGLTAAPDGWPALPG